MIDKKQLKQLYNLNREIDHLKRQIENMSGEPQIVTDSVTASSRSFPYTQHIVLISGVQDFGDRLERLKSRLANRLDKVIETVEKLNAEIEAIPDSEIRLILTMRYINNLEWKQIARKIGGGNTADGVRMIHNRYLDKI